MIWESQQSNSKNPENNENYTKHYVYEPKSFVPLLQTGYTGFIKLLETPDYAQFQHEDYSVYKDPLWKTETRKNKAELERVLFYHCDQVGTPQTLSNELGECIWEIKQDVWGEAIEIKASHNLLEQTNIRFQGQYYDGETGLHYNRYRYYEPHSARYVSKDPIGLLGGLHNTKYVSDPNQWVDPMGLQKQKPLEDGLAKYTRTLNEGILKEKKYRQNEDKSARQAAKIFGEIMDEHHANQAVCEEQLIEYIACSGGVGPFAGGFAVNLYNGKVFSTGSASPIAAPLAMIKTINKGPISLKDFSKLAKNNLFSKGGECVGGYVANKKIRDPMLALNSFLTGKSETYAVGYRGVRGGVVIPDGEKLFDKNGIKGIQFGVGSSGIDYSVGYGNDSGYELNLLKKK